MSQTSELGIFGAPVASEEGTRVRFWHVVRFMAFLAPISISVADDGVSANYLFAILLLSSHGYRRNWQAAAYIGFMTFALLVGALVFSGMSGVFLLRQFISYSLMLFGVLLLFVRLSSTLEEFLVALVICSVGYALYVFYMFAFGGFSLTDIYKVKGGLQDFVTDWPQRYVVLLLLAFFVAVRRFGRGIHWQIAAAIILPCIFLTFTRAAWLGMVAAFAVYPVLAIFSKDRGVGGPGRASWLALVGLVGLIAVGIYVAENPEVAGAFVTFTDDFSDTAQTKPGEFSASGSEGQRLDLYSEIVDTIQANPLTGTGFAGAYLVIPGEGSAHGQYMDILLRTGIIGLIIYLLFWLKALRYYANVDRGVAAGLIAVFVMGFFHETTKLSYGCFMFFFLLNKVYAAEPRG